MFDGAGWVETRAERDLRLLRAARAEIARPGAWYYGAIGVEGVSMCAIGWLLEVAAADGEPETNKLPERLLWPALPQWWRGGSCPDRSMVARYNDAPWRRKRAVVRLYDRAIRLAERRR